MKYLDLIGDFSGLRADYDLYDDLSLIVVQLSYDAGEVN